MSSKSIGIIEILAKRFLKVENLVYVLDEDKNLVCLIYDLEASRSMLFEYLKKHQLDVEKLEFGTTIPKKKAADYHRLIQFKIVTLDDELVLFKDVVEKAKTHDIEGYDGKLPKFGMNVYKTIN
jgi:hypothetical protein